MTTHQPGGILSAAFLIVLIQIGIFALIITLVVINRARFKQFYKTGLIIGVASFCLSLPYQLMILSRIDMEKILGQINGLSSESFVSSPEFASLIQGLMMFFSILIMLLAVGWQMFSYVAAAGEWEKLRPNPFPVFMRAGERGWDKIGIAALVGVGAALLSVFIARLLGVGANELVQTQEAFVKSNEVPGAIQIIFTLFFLAGAALTEEILFRGALLGWLFRLSKNRMVFLLASIFIVSFVWALMHIFNTNSPAFKLAQIFILGTVFAEFARRWSLESAIAGHLALNLTAGIIAFLV